MCLLSCYKCNYAVFSGVNRQGVALTCLFVFSLVIISVVKVFTLPMLYYRNNVYFGIDGFLSLNK